jgi:surface polysaccharide O-acyltransferase-like enzyme
MKKGREYYIDYLRVIATYAVIIWHCISSVYYQFGPLHEWAPASLLFGVMVRWSVPVFIMISGGLLLEKDEPIAVFYKKRFLRICLPLITWTIIYGVMRLYHFTAYTPPKPSFLKFVIFDQFHALLFNKLSFHLYFVSIILGLYLISPFLSRMIRSLSKRQVELLLAIGICSYSLKAILPDLIVVDNFQVGSNLVYFILGFYLHTYPPGKKGRQVIYLTGIVSAILMTWLNYTTEYLHKGHQDTYYLTSGFFVYSISTAVFVLFQRNVGMVAGTGIRNIVNRIMVFISSCSYGIYIAHPLIMNFLLFSNFSFFSFSTNYCIFTLPGYKISLTMDNAWGAIVLSGMVLAFLVLLLYPIKKSGLLRYFS